MLLSMHSICHIGFIPCPHMTRSITVVIVAALQGRVVPYIE
jgi:hypothetical protein